LCRPADGKILNKWGPKEGGQKQGEFYDPHGISLCKFLKCVYVCDYDNHRVQILGDNGKFAQQLGSGKKSLEKGQFTYPCSIYYYELEEIFYIGDEICIQLFNLDNQCIQKLGNTKGNGMNQFNRVYSTCIIDDRLYVSDSLNKRIQIFGRN